MSRYENGVHAPPLQFVEAVGKVLGMPAAFFYCRDDRLAELIRIYAELPEAKREALFGFGLNLAK